MATKKTRQLEQFEAKAPPILVWKGQQQWQKPRYEVRYFHRRKVEVWSGYVRTSDVKGWVDNVRIKLFVEKWGRDHGGGLPTNGDILDWMDNDLYDEFDLTNLANSIVKNGVRQPIVITAKGTLLDGNRRYFAALLKLRDAETAGDKATLDMVTYLPAYVLSPACTKEDLDAVLVEENFVDDCRRAWPNFIKASKVFDAYKELRDAEVNRAVAITQLVERFGMKKAHVERWIKMMDFIEEFHDYHSSEDEETGRKPKDQYEIKWKTQKYFEYFDELSKTQVVKSLEGDPEFREKVFERLYDDDFISFVQIRKLPAIIGDRRARDKFILGTGTDAVKDAIDWVTVTGIAKKAMDVNDRIMSFKRFLDSLTVQDIDNLDKAVISALRDIANKVASAAVAVKGK
ncbi:MAG: ParB N-terminal domain-containing protein [bacterium]